MQDVGFFTDAQACIIGVSLSEPHSNVELSVL